MTTPVESPRHRARIHTLCTVTVAFVWIWHGLVPKLLGPHPDELAMLTNAGVSAAAAPTIVTVIGGGEIAFGVVCLALGHHRWPWLLTIVTMLGVIAGVLVTSPHFLTAAFGPVTLNVQVAALAAIALLTRRENDQPSA